MAQYDGTERRDTITGSEFADIIFGFGGNDSVNGGAGNDDIYGGDGIDRLNGADGDDILNGSNPNSGDGLGDIFDGGAGNDVINGYGRAGSNNIAFGGGGDDLITMSGQDPGSVFRLYGEDGNDAIYAYARVSGVLDGGADIDRAEVSLEGALGSTGGTFDLSTYWRNLSITFNELTIRDFEVLDLTFGSGEDVVTIGNRPDDPAYYLSVNLGDGADRAIGGDADDRIVGGSGDDVIEGGSGADHLDGDGISGRNGSDVILGGDGDDSILGGGGNSQLDGGDGDDFIAGKDRNDVIEGGAGDDTIDGRKGRDRLSGGDGADVINDGDQRDIIIGGTGTDIMYSFEEDAGNRFVFAEGDTGNTIVLADEIIGFRSSNRNHSIDVIDLRKVDATSSTAHNESFSFIGQAEFSGQAGELRFQVASEYTIIEGDTNGDGLSDFMIRLNDAIVLNILDFRL